MHLWRDRPAGTVDAATALLDLIASADATRFMVGTAHNLARQNTGFRESISLRGTVVENLAKRLEAEGRETELRYYRALT